MCLKPWPRVSWDKPANQVMVTVSNAADMSNIPMSITSTFSAALFAAGKGEVMLTHVTSGADLTGWNSASEIIFKTTVSVNDGIGTQEVCSSRKLTSYLPMSLSMTFDKKIYRLITHESFDDLWQENQIRVATPQSSTVEPFSYILCLHSACSRHHMIVIIGELAKSIVSKFIKKYNYNLCMLLTIFILF